ncbi:uncharacterized protein LOC134537202 [Bacillus rossius redtenbacheri]|uniref:uncharacterized protein LOC134537202 n=1 Tax=Bacillus rossius redtenbacheri TaxID=93214 RepID=UPI002FDD32CD
MPTMCGRPFALGNKLGCAVPRLGRAADVHRVQDVFPTSQKLVLWEGEILTAETLSRLEDPALSAPDAATPASGCVSLATPAAGQHLTGGRHRPPGSLAPSPPPFVPAALPPRARDDVPSSRPAERGAGVYRPVFQRRPPTPHQMPVASSPPVSMEAMSRIVKEFQSKRDSDVMIKSDVGSSGKKSRARPQVQPELDVGTLARADDLGRANTATLVKWLRERGITCKVKDKKSDLVAKVRGHLALPSSAPCDA